MASRAREDIVVTLPDGKQVEGKTWETTPYTVAAGISKGLVRHCFYCRGGSNLDSDSQVRRFDKHFPGSVRFEFENLDLEVRKP